MTCGGGAFSIKCFDWSQKLFWLLLRNIDFGYDKSYYEVQRPVSEFIAQLTLLSFIFSINVSTTASISSLFKNTFIAFFANILIPTTENTASLRAPLILIFHTRNTKMFWGALWHARRTSSLLWTFWRFCSSTIVFCFVSSAMQLSLGVSAIFTWWMALWLPKLL